ncbi:MAG TPA: hypothetical protein VHE83_15540 [Mycobacteriales bacterium]|nr:hypothetical protein [Mycobacteriales bacterium]
MRRRTTVSVVALAAVAMLAGCGSSKKAADNTPTTTTPTTAAATCDPSATPPSTAATPADAATTTAISTAYTKFFDPATPQADKLKYLQDASSLSQLIATLAANPSSKETSAKVDSVALADECHAIVTYDLSSKGAVVLPGSKGKAVKVNGQWQVSKETFCALASLAVTNGQLPGCS